MFLAHLTKQSGGAMLTPFEQGKRYADNQPLDEKPRWIVTCNFTTFAVYDMKVPSKKLGKEWESVKLADLEREWYRLAFLADLNKGVEKRLWRWIAVRVHSCAASVARTRW